MCGHHLCRVVGTAGGPQHREAVGGGLGRRPGDSFARSADVILHEPGLPMPKGVGTADCMVQEIHCFRHANMR